ncbi:MAG: type I phosphomannose isomerase catalytic subunit [Brevinema sp.]
MKLYPMLFSSVFKEKVWGGRALETVLGKELPSTQLYGESWEVSAHENGLGTVLNGKFQGKTLPDLLKNHADSILGTTITEKYGDIFPLLLKFLDINDKLSIQVHPNDFYAIPVEKSLGKAECWYIISASSDAKLIMGMKANISSDDYIQKAKNNDFSDLFEEVSVQAGDLVVISPGMVHASLEGSILLCELQQNSDITYRIYDFDRLENGIKRPLHIQKSADVIDFEAKADIRHFGDKTEAITTLLDWEYFTLIRLIVNKTTNRPSSPVFKLYSVLSGSVTVICDNDTLTLKKGGSFLLPAGLEILIEGEGELLEAIPK